MRKMWMWLLGAVVVLGLGVAGICAERRTAVSRYQESFDFEAARKYQEALDALDKVSPNAGEKYFLELRRGWLHYLLGQTDEAIGSYERAADLEPKAVEPLLGKMLPEMAARRWADVEKSARAVLELDPGNYTALSRQAYSLYLLKNYKEAEGVYRAVLGLYPSDATMKSGLAWSLFMQGKKDDAARLFGEVLAIYPYYATAAQGREAARGGSRLP